MNITIFTTQFYEPSGAEGLQVDLARELTNRDGVSVRLLHQGHKDDPRFFGPTDRLRRMGVTVDALDLGFHPSLTRLYKNKKKLRDYLTIHNTHIIETSQATPSILAAMAAQKTKCKLVAGVHAPMRATENRGVSARLRNYLWCSAVRRHAQNYAISSQVADCWSSFAGIPRDDIKVIYNSISPEYFQATPNKLELARSLGISSSCPWLLFVGRMRKDKGVLTLLAAASQMTGHPLEVLFVGGVELGHESVSEAVRQANQSGPLAGHAHYLGYRSDVSTLMASSDLFVLPTEREGFGMVLIEAMAAGCDVVTTDVDALPEVLAGSNTAMIPPAAPDALAQAILEKLSQPPLQRAERLRQLTEHAQKFTLKKRADTILEWFDTFI